MSISTLSAGSVVATSGQISFADGNGLAFQASGQAIAMALPSVAFWHNSGFAVVDATLPIASSAPNCLLNRVSFGQPITATRAELYAKVTGGTASATSGASGGYTLSLGLYALSQSTAQLVSSASAAVSWSAGGASTDPTGYVGQSGLRARSLDLDTWNIDVGEYVLAAIGSYSGNGAGWSFVGSGITKILEPAGQGMPYFEPAAVYSAATGALPATIHIADQAQSASCIVPTVALMGAQS